MAGAGRRGELSRHLVLVGLPGCGKTTVGRLAARELGVPFVDLDERIEARAGLSIPEIFRRRGEEAFRALEREEMRRVVAEPPAVVAPGGGWAAQPGALEEVEGRALVVYLETDPETAAFRASGSGDRPLLSGEDLLGRMRELYRARSPFYGRAGGRVAADRGPPEEVAREVASLARSRAGW